MWIIVNDQFQHKRYINVKYITNFYFGSEVTFIQMVDGESIKAFGDYTKDIMTTIRMSDPGIGVKKIGE